MKLIKFSSNKDERRHLFDWEVNFDCKSIKLLFIKSGFTVGSHFHKDKDELFILIDGIINTIQVGSVIKKNIKGPSAWIVKRGIYHSYHSDTPYTLICLASQVFNPMDDFVNDQE